MRTRLSGLQTRLQNISGFIARQGLFGRHLYNSGARFASTHARSDEFYAANVRTFVKKNQALPKFFEDIQLNPAKHDKYLQMLMRAVNQHEFSAEIYAEIIRNPDSLQYILYLIENKKIPLWEGVTLYQYVTAAAQYSQPELLSPKDKDIFSPRKIKLIRLAEDGKLTDDGKQFLEHFIKQMAERTSLQLNVDELAEFVIHSSATDQYLMEFEQIKPRLVNNDLNGLRGDSFIRDIANSVPFFKGYVEDTFIYPPSTFMNFIMSKMSNRIATGRPILGSVADARRTIMHEDDEHPLPLYNRCIFSNIRLTHEGRYGPVPTNIHDWAHLFWMNMLQPEERDLILLRLIPMLMKLKQDYEDDPDIGLSEGLDKIIWQLADFDLTSKIKYLQPESRLFDYIKLVFDYYLFPDMFSVFFGGNVNHMAIPDVIIVFRALQSFVATERVEGRMSESLRLLDINLGQFLQLYEDDKAIFKRHIITLENVYDYSAAKRDIINAENHTVHRKQ